MLKWMSSIAAAAIAVFLFAGVKSSAAMVPVEKIEFTQPLESKVESHKGVQSLFIKSKSNWNRLCDIRTLPKGTQLWHWGIEGAIGEWVKQGRITSSNLHDPETGRVQGLYVSTNPVDSINFGIDAFVSTLTSNIVEAFNFADFTKMNPEDFQNIDYLFRNGLIDVLQHNGVAVIGEYTSGINVDGKLIPRLKTWKYVIGEAAFRRVKVATTEGILNSHYFAENEMPLGSLLNLDVREPINPNNEWFKKRFPALAKMLLGKKPTTQDLENLTTADFARAQEDAEEIEELGGKPSLLRTAILSFKAPHGSCLSAFR